MHGSAHPPWSSTGPHRPRAASHVCADTANYGESRKKQAPLQIKIGDRFDNPAIHSRIVSPTPAPFLDLSCCSLLHDPADGRAFEFRPS